MNRLSFLPPPPPYGAWPWIAALMFATALLLYLAGDRPGRTPAPAAPVHTSALADCPPPTEHELLQITVAHRGGRFVASCTYLGPRGAYKRSRHGLPEPRP